MSLFNLKKSVHRLRNSSTNFAIILRNITLKLTQLKSLVSLKKGSYEKINRMRDVGWVIADSNVVDRLIQLLLELCLYVDKRKGI